MANYTCIPAPVFDHSKSPFMRKGAAYTDQIVENETDFVSVLPQLNTQKSTTLPLDDISK